MTIRPNRIPSAPVQALFPGVESVGQITLGAETLGYGPAVLPILHPYEQMVLAAIVQWRRPRRMLEIGTARGHTTRILAANAPADALVVTVDLPPGERGEYSLRCLHGDGDIGKTFAETREGARIHQILSDSRRLDPGQLHGAFGTMDLILVDGDHGYEAVRADTRLALALAGPRTVILWHDFYPFPSYIAEGPAARGVYPALNELEEEGPVVLRHIIGTYYVAGCLEWPQDLAGDPVQPEEVPAPFGRGIVRLAAASRNGTE